MVIFMQRMLSYIRKAVDDYNMIEEATNQHKYIINYSNIDMEKSEEYFIKLKNVYYSNNI